MLIEIKEEIIEEGSCDPKLKENIASFNWKLISKTVWWDLMIIPDFVSQMN